MMGSNSIQIPIALAYHTSPPSSLSPLTFSLPLLPRSPLHPSLRRRFQTLRLAIHRRSSILASSSSAAGVTNSAPRNGNYTVSDFMTTKEHLHVVKPSTTVDQALDFLVEKRITGFPVIDDDWKLVGVVSDYDLLALDSISGNIGGGSQHDTNLFPDVDSSWKEGLKSIRCLREKSLKPDPQTLLAPQIEGFQALALTILSLLGSPRRVR
ncbi:CBS domain-containing protein CBSX2, chloroplastic-like isoform X2 [Rosa rugosa]|uniref:CBS domain-containing protein CBSX2, chloroplastic-like isoform X2 n=1 Tax=Rosa rugosa TaxID=74645 RepID=UPI002B411637|nr:CBS domain-containing protein CBSX2, chloroplastic-like isoform X2 [Rosa rugosa]